MSNQNQPDLHKIDWNSLPTPVDDGGADHLEGMDWPKVTLLATSGENISLQEQAGLTILFAYPMTGRPTVALPDNWDMIPGARGCTPQACAFGDLHSQLLAKGVSRVYGLSVQDPDYQREAAARLHLPFPLLSDTDRHLQLALNLPVMEVENMVLLRRLTIAVRNGQIEKVWYPVFPPDRSAQEVLNWLG